MSVLLSFLKTIAKWILPFVFEFISNKVAEFLKRKKEKKEASEKHEKDKQQKIDDLKKAETVEERKEAHEDILNS